MKKLICMGMGLLLCLSAALFVGCEEKPLDEPAAAETPAEEVGENYVEKAFGMELQMVYIQGGSFMMGATEEQGDDVEKDEKPVHKVTLNDFYIGKFEVTQAQWEAVMGTTIIQQCEMDLRLDSAVVAWLYNCGVGDVYPMYCVNWEEATTFCEKLSQMTGKTYRLPTEAEWEYAARGGQKADGTKYAGSNVLEEVAWYDENSYNLGEKHLDYGVHAVGQKKSNGLGLYDMSGNVHEYCLDWMDFYGERSIVNPRGPISGEYRVARGGNWHSGASDCRVSGRGIVFPDVRFGNVGFRVVCER